MTYQYKMSGLDYVWLINGYEEHETEYGPGVSIHKGEHLDSAIALAIINSPVRLRGQEVKFLRTLLKISQTEFATNLGVQRITVARWESKLKTPIPGPADRLLRVLVGRQFICADCLGDLVDDLSEISSGPMPKLLMRYSSARDDEPNLFHDLEDEETGEGWRLSA